MAKIKELSKVGMDTEPCKQIGHTYVGGPKKYRTGFGEIFLIVVECSPARWV